MTVKAEELHGHPLFAGVPFAFLKWNQGAVGRRTLNDGDILCEQGEVRRDGIRDRARVRSRSTGRRT